MLHLNAFNEHTCKTNQILPSKFKILKKKSQKLTNVQKLQNVKLLAIAASFICKHYIDYGSLRMNSDCSGDHFLEYKHS